MVCVDAVLLVSCSEFIAARNKAVADVVKALVIIIGLLMSWVAMRYILIKVESVKDNVVYARQKARCVYPHYVGTA